MEEASKEYSVLLTIFSFLEVKHLLTSAALVCKTWAHLSKEPLVRNYYYIIYFNELIFFLSFQLWQKIVERDYGTAFAIENHKLAWKELWRQLSQRKFDPLRSNPNLEITKDHKTGADSFSLSRYM